jgi:SAM-dependent methyltransferase
LEEIKRFWQTKSAEFAESPTGAHSDPNIVALENDLIVRHLERSRPRHLIDIGCGNGKRTRLFSQYAREGTVGLDSADAAIHFAKTLESDKLHFYVDDVLTTSWQHKYRFDCVVSCRCLINLGTLENQLRVIDTVADSLPSGGMFIFCETSRKGTEILNSLRTKLRLAPIVQLPANLDMNEEAVMDHISRRFEVMECSRFGTYYFLTRCYYPAAVAPTAPDPKSQFNRVAAEIERISPQPALEPYGRQFCIAARKL